MLKAKPTLEMSRVARVVLTAPSKGEMKNVVFGVNNSDILDEDKIPAASCTTMRLLNS